MRVPIHFFERLLIIFGEERTGWRFWVKEMSTILLERYGLSRSEIADKLERKRRNEEWLRKHIPALRKEYVGCYVAISDGEVKAKGKTLASLFRNLKKQGLDQEIISTFAIDLITEEDVIWIL